MTEPTTNTTPKGAPLISDEEIKKIINDAVARIVPLTEREIRKQVDAIFKRPQDHKLVGTPLPGVGRAKRLAEDRKVASLVKVTSERNKTGPYILIDEATEMFQAMSEDEQKRVRDLALDTKRHWEKRNSTFDVE